VVIVAVVVVVMETEQAIGMLDWNRKIITYYKIVHDKPDITLNECKD
jgi:hypothetical protein